MEDLAALIQRIRQDLLEIQEKLNWAAVQNAAQPERRHVVSYDLVRDFKNTIDDMRHFLWAYMEGVTHGELATQTFRMQRATEMLRTLRSGMGSTQLAEAETHSFLEALNGIASDILEKHMKDKA
jgi:hypothetical protein